MSFLSFRTQAMRLGAAILCGISAIHSAYAQPIYNGEGPINGVTLTSGLSGIPHDSDPRATIISILEAVLSFMALISVVAIVIAGIYLIVGLGSDDSKEKAKKIVQYTLIGLMIILFSRVIVSLVTVYLANQVGS